MGYVDFEVYARFANKAMLILNMYSFVVFDSCFGLVFYMYAICCIKIVSFGLHQNLYAFACTILILCVLADCLVIH